MVSQSRSKLVKLSEVSKLSVEERFLYWIKERHNIYKKKEKRKPKPWTDDEVLQEYFFTNPYRENDKVTKWFRKNVREPMEGKDSILFATIAFRWFNKPHPTGRLMLRHNLLTKWNEKKAVRLINEAKVDGPVFTGAYMIKAGNGPPGCKVPNVCSSITTVWDQRKRLVKVCKDDCRLQALWKELTGIRFLGGFMAYEIVTDLRHTHLLEDATDIDTWANVGPGAKRGMNRILGLEPPNLSTPLENWEEDSQRLLRLVNRKLKSIPRFEMREIEHSLCEFDKYERARTGSGKMKRKYKGTA